MPLNRQTFPDPVTVGTIRENGHRLIMCCFGCGRDVEIDQSAKSGIETELHTIDDCIG
jgi:hypothetical protein